VRRRSAASDRAGWRPHPSPRAVCWPGSRLGSSCGCGSCSGSGTCRSRWGRRALCRPDCPSWPCARSAPRGGPGRGRSSARRHRSLPHPLEGDRPRGRHAPSAAQAAPESQPREDEARHHRLPLAEITGARLGVEPASALDQRADLNGAIEVRALTRSHSETPSPTPRGIALEIAVLHRHLQDLAEPRQRLVDHLVPERAPADGLAALAGRAQCVALADLEMPVAVDLLDRDLGQPVLRKNGSR
jgi:hypothetical protein